MTRRVGVGHDIDGDIKVVEAMTTYRIELTRSWIVFVLLVVGGLALLGAMAMGIYDGSFLRLQILWNILGPLLGAMMMHYFARGPNCGRSRG